MSTIVEAWFGKHFAELHPLLQRLHREGGVLAGPVHVSFGRGLSGVLGKRLASRMGVPATTGAHQLQVTIDSEAGVLHWGRCFNGQSAFNSRFQPVGHYPSGHWVEHSGPLSLVLGVEIKDGGWHWQHRKSAVFGIPVPKSLLPTTLASKRMEAERYQFSVEVRAPVFGQLLAYSGTLALRLLGRPAVSS
jgi:Domain of unknown function (DUF4166)